MTVVVWICAAMLGVAALLTLLRMALGPTTLNRTVAMDTFVAILVAGLGVGAAYTRSTTSIPIIVVLSLVGFVGSVSVARFVGREGKGGTLEGESS
ncbi:MAG: multiple resistance and pH regulation protein [Nocardioidaceae bacterium]|nr:multiple resistance and pH regulation protein [Nocardioidaceae bacterium]